MNDYEPHPIVCRCEACIWRRAEQLMVDLDWFYFRRMTSEVIARDKASAN